MEQLDYIETLEEARHLISPQRYRFILAESLVVCFSRHTKSITEIMKYTNSILEDKDIEPISMGFVRRIAEK